MKKHPEYLILIAVVVALVAGILCFTFGCSALLTKSAQAASGSAGKLIEEILDSNDGDYGTDIDDVLGIGDDYTQNNMPSSMEIETDELTSDLQSIINQDITSTLQLSESDDITVSDLTKDQVETPELRNGYVLCQVSGKATIKNVLGKTQTVDYTSYYYAGEPSASTTTWYIYSYDLSDYSVLPQGLEDVAGNPLGIRDYLQLRF